MLPTPFPLGPFLVEADGKLSFRAPQNRAVFSYLWRGRRFNAVLASGEISLAAAIGRVPSSADGRASRRLAVLNLVRALPRVMPPGLAVRLLPDHRVDILLHRALDWPANTGALITPLVQFSLAVAPYFDLFDEANATA